MRLLLAERCCPRIAPRAGAWFLAARGMGNENLQVLRLLSEVGKVIVLCGSTSRSTASCQVAARSRRALRFGGAIDGLDRGESEDEGTSLARKVLNSAGPRPDTRSARTTGRFRLADRNTASDRARRRSSAGGSSPTADRDREGNPRRARRSAILIDECVVHAITLRDAVRVGTRAFAPRSGSPAHLDLVDPVEDIAAQAEPGGVGVKVIHHFAPDPHRQAEFGFFFPGDRLGACNAPSSAAWKMVPLNKKQSGISPSSSAAKYLVAATLKSNVQGTGSSTEVLPQTAERSSLRGSRAARAESGPSARVRRKGPEAVPSRRPGSAFAPARSGSGTAERRRDRRRRRDRSRSRGAETPIAAWPRTAGARRPRFYSSIRACGGSPRDRRGLQLVEELRGFLARLPCRRKDRASETRSRPTSL